MTRELFETNRKTYDNSKHKAQSNWKDILRLISIALELLERIIRLEKAVSKLNKILTRIKKDEI